MAQDEEHESAKNILIVFAQYGFRKTSMEEIANAAGISRQSVYKKFGTKEKCYQWMIHTYLSGMYSKVFALLEKDDLPPMQILLNVFDISIGQAVEIIHNPHRLEIFKDALQATHASGEDWPLRYRARLADFLKLHGYASEETATGAAFCLISAGKGLLLEEPSREQFLDDMKTIIENVCTT